MAYAALGQRERAIQDYDQAIRLDPANAVAYGNRGNAHARGGELERAVRDYDQVIRINPRAATAWLNRVIVRAGLGDRTGATADLAEARRLDPTLDADAARINFSAPAAAGSPVAAAPVAPAAPAAPAPAAPAPVAPAPVAAAPVAAPAVDRDALFWQSIQASTNAGDFEAYLRQFPNGTFAELARNRVAALRPAAAAAAMAAADELSIVEPQLSWVNDAQSGQPTLVIQGVIRNAAAAPRAIPALRVIMRDGEVEVHSSTFTAAAAQVGARAEVPYRTEIVDPPQASTLSIVFVTGR